ncbi:MAG: hypothetical protein AB7T37_14025 [Dehalococcoidia bacterium]
MPKLSNRPTPIAATLLAGALIGALLTLSHALAQPPQIPATFFGTVSVDGAPVPPGTLVRAFVDGVDCTQPGGSGAFDEGGASHYLVDVMHESQAPGCGRTGAEVSFKVGNQSADVAATWNSGPYALDLFVGTPPTSAPSGRDAAESSGGGRAWLLPSLVAAALLAAAGAAVFALLRKARGNPRSTGSPPSS